MLTRSNPEFSLHTYTHTQSYRTKCDFVLYVFGAWKNEHPDKRVFLRAFFLIQIFPHTQQAVLEHQHTNTCEHSRRTHTHTAKVTHSHTCARFLGGYRSWRCLTVLPAFWGCFDGRRRKTLSHLPARGNWHV